MARVAPRIHVAADAIARLEGTALLLPQDERVQVERDDGTRLRGIVECTPTIQAFFDPRGREGMNALLRLEILDDHGRTDASCDVWLDEIRSVNRLPNPSPPERSSRVAPPDPNAPTVD